MVKIKRSVIKNGIYGYNIGLDKIIAVLALIFITADLAETTINKLNI